MLKTYKQALYTKLVQKFSKIDRIGISTNYIKGEGIEIGALNYPLLVPKNVKVRYVDRISAEEHTKIFEGMKLKEMVHVDIIDNGETLDTVEDASQDFVIANHFIEHCQNPIMTIENLLRVLRNGGVLFMAIPEKRYTFDITREETSMEHFIKDYVDGPQWSEEMHYQDFVRKTSWSDKCKTDEDIAKVIQHLKEISFSIHFHVWSHPSMIDFFQVLKKQLHFPFEIEFSVAPLNGGNESIFILRKV